MSDTNAPSPAVGVPANDGAIERALADLERKLADWLEAMKAGHTAISTGLANGARRPVQSATQPSAAPQPAAQPPAKAGRRRSKLFVDRTLPAAPPAATGHAAPPQHSHPQAAPADTLPDQSEPTADAAHGAEDEEALLATLDAATANALRLRRRLEGGRRSVRELLAEFRAAQAPAGTPEAERFWWRRHGHERHGG